MVARANARRAAVSESWGGGLGSRSSARGVRSRAAALARDDVPGERTRAAHKHQTITSSRRRPLGVQPRDFLEPGAERVPAALLRRRRPQQARVVGAAGKLCGAYVGCVRVCGVGVCMWDACIHACMHGLWVGSPHGLVATTACRLQRGRPRPRPRIHGHTHLTSRTRTSRCASPAGACVCVCVHECVPDPQQQEVHTTAECASRCRASSAWRNADDHVHMQSNQSAKKHNEKL